MVLGFIDYAAKWLPEKDWILDLVIKCITFYLTFWQLNE